MPASNAGFLVQPSGTPPQLTPKQVVILQCVNADGSIAWQRYFYGATPATLPAGDEWRRATCARGISVWAAPRLAGQSDTDTRIAICGEKSDDEIPLSQSPGAVTSPFNPLRPDFTGFVAVFDGEGSLLWSYDFHGISGATTFDLPDSAITDVSIRTETIGEEVRDVVTYCGISSFGTFLGVTPLYPKRAFAAGHGCPNAAGGNTHNGQNQWDGIVGRLSNIHVSPVPTATLQEFHSNVGGGEQDGLFGIAEMENQRFVVVGCTSRLTIPGTSATFPFDFGCGNIAAHRVGVVMTFDAAATRTPGGDLVLQASVPLGSMANDPATGLPYATVARDVLVQLDCIASLDPSTVPPTTGGTPEFHVVGATNDPFLFTASPLAAFPPQVGSQLATLQGPADGFVLSFLDGGGPLANGLYPLGGGYVGGPGIDGLTGISSWNEHQDHMQVCGYSIEGGDTNILLSSLFLNQSCEYLLVGSQLQLVPDTDPMIRIRTDVLGGGQEDRPTALGRINATEFSLGFPGSGGRAFLTGLEVGALPTSDNIGNPAGGGIAVDETSRVTVVGRTRSTFGVFYPTLAPPFPVGRPVNIIGGFADAVRTSVDMLPNGVSRTDATGSRVAGGGSAPPPFPAPGYTGGTTPACALLPFGRRVNEATPLLPRMLVEFDGVNAVGQSPSFLFTRPPNTGVVLGTFLQFGFPGVALPAGPTPLMFYDTECWLLDPSVIAFLAPSPSLYFGWPAGWNWYHQGYQSWRFTMTSPLAVGPISVQLLTLTTCSLSTWPCSGCDGAATIVASPALTLEF